MPIIKSYSVGNGDMFYINHGSDNFTIIDCCLNDDVEESILNEIHAIKQGKTITRFISTHPDEDHIRGLEKLHDKIDILNFYCVRNQVIKVDETISFLKYCELRDSADKVFHVSKSCNRKWMNQGCDQRGASGVNILWPNTDNRHFKMALQAAERGESPNNISAIVKYSMSNGVTALWMGDLETDFMSEIENDLDIPKVDLLFAPHHGRDSGRIPDLLLEKMDPKIIIVGEAPSEHLHYYPGYNTITQNSAGDIIFDCQDGVVHLFTSSYYYADFLYDHGKVMSGHHYIGTLQDLHANQVRTRVS